MKYLETALEGVYIVEPKVFGDERGWFAETFRLDLFREIVPNVEFVQENESFSEGTVVRGLHYQLPPFAQAKLVRVVEGRVLDVAVDIREGSPTFGEHVAVELSDKNQRQLFVPRGFAHGFAVLGKRARLQYKCDNYYAPHAEGGVLFSDPAIGIDWGVELSEAIMSQKDMEQPLLKDAKLFTYGEKY